MGALSSLGIESSEETVYRELLITHGAKAAELSARLRMPQFAVEFALQGLERKGLASRSPYATPTFLAVPPDVAIEALIAQRQSELHRARATVAELRDLARSQRVKREHDERVAEILSEETISKVFPEIMTAARDEIICFERLPMLVWDAMPNDAELQCLARGVRIRIIADSAMLKVPRHLQRLRSAVQAGETYRVFSGLPLKMVIVDRAVGIVPVTTSPSGSSHLLVRSSPLLQAFCDIFDVFWRVAAPFSVGEDEDAGQDDADTLLPLLAAGLNDKAIEQELRISRRTLTRRVADLMRQHGAATRFQFGWLTAKSQPIASKRRP